MTETETAPQTPPACPRCGVTMFPSRRAMRSHDITSGQAVPLDKVVDSHWKAADLRGALRRRLAESH